MARLEYRLYIDEEHYTPLYYYESIDLEQIITRRECEFFVKDGVTYREISSAYEGNEVFVIYVETHNEGPKDVESGSEKLVLEVRMLNHVAGHPLIKKIEVDTHLEVMGFIGSSFTYFEGKEWLRDSAEIDEDRKLYVLYVTPTGFIIEDKVDTNHEKY